jgi:hypothetical protein
MNKLCLVCLQHEYGSQFKRWRREDDDGFIYLILASEEYPYRSAVVSWFFSIELEPRRRRRRRRLISVFLDRIYDFCDDDDDVNIRYIKPMVIFVVVEEKKMKINDKK